MVACERQVDPPFDVGRPCEYDPAVWRNADAIGCAAADSDVGDDLSAGAERGVECTSGGIADQGEFSPLTHECVTAHQHAPVGLQRQRHANVREGTERSRHLASVPEGRVERSVDVVPGDSEIKRAVTLRSAPEQDPAIGLDRKTVGTVDTGPEAGRDLAVEAETRVKRAVGLVAHKDEVERVAEISVAAKQDPTVGLHGHVPCVHVRAERRDRKAVRSEAGVERPIRLEANEREGAHTGRRGDTTQQDSPIRLQRDTSAVFSAAPDPDGDLSARTEGGVE